MANLFAETSNHSGLHGMAPSRRGNASAPVPVFWHPPFGCAAPSMAPLASKPGSIGTGSPGPPRRARRHAALVLRTGAGGKTLVMLTIAATLVAATPVAQAHPWDRHRVERHPGSPAMIGIRVWQQQTSTGWGATRMPKATTTTMPRSPIRISAAGSAAQAAQRAGRRDGRRLATIARPRRPGKVGHRGPTAHRHRGPLCSSVENPHLHQERNRARGGENRRAGWDGQNLHDSAGIRYRRHGDVDSLH